MYYVYKLIIIRIYRKFNIFPSFFYLLAVHYFYRSSVGGMGYSRTYRMFTRIRSTVSNATLVTGVSSPFSNLTGSRATGYKAVHGWTHVSSVWTWWKTEKRHRCCCSHRTLFATMTRSQCDVVIRCNCDTIDSRRPSLCREEFTLCRDVHVGDLGAWRSSMYKMAIACQAPRCTGAHVDELDGREAIAVRAEHAFYVAPGGVIFNYIKDFHLQFCFMWLSNFNFTLSI